MACGKNQQIINALDKNMEQSKDRGKEWSKFSCYETAEERWRERPQGMGNVEGSILAAFKTEQIRRK